MREKNQETVVRLRNLVKELSPLTSWIYGSFLNKRFEEIGDIDLVLVVEKEDEKSSINNEMKTINGKELDFLVISYGSVLKRISSNTL
jgi:predicted nucleotidyltransferase